MNAILEAPAMTVDPQEGSLLRSGSPASGESMNVFPAALVKGKRLFPSERSAAQGELPAPQRLFPLPGKSRRCATSTNAAAGSAAHVCPSPEPVVPQTPGEALLQEFDALYDKYQRRVYRQCFRMLGNAEDAEDLTQEVFLQLFRKAHTFRGESTFSTWLHRLTINTVLMRLRRHRRWREVVTSMDVAPGSQQEVSDVLTKVRTLSAPNTDTLDRISLDVAIAQLKPAARGLVLMAVAAPSSSSPPTATGLGARARCTHFKVLPTMEKGPAAHWWWTRPATSTAQLRKAGGSALTTTHAGWFSG